jgi:hypothetical protein
MANALESIKLILEELGPTTQQIDEIVKVDDTNWAIRLDDEGAIGLEWIEESPRLIMTSYLGQASAERATDIYRTLLAYNILSPLTDGIKMAMSGIDGEIVLMQELFGEKLSLSSIRTALLEFSVQATKWESYVISDAPDIKTTEPMEQLLT